MPETKTWNTRYIAYAKAHKRTPEDQLAQDHVDWPGGVMAGFTIWISEQWYRWSAVAGEKPAHGDCGWSDEQQHRFDAWLDGGRTDGRQAVQR